MSAEPSDAVTFSDLSRNPRAVAERAIDRTAHEVIAGWRATARIKAAANQRIVGAPSVDITAPIGPIRGRSHPCPCPAQAPEPGTHGRRWPGTASWNVYAQVSDI